MFKKLHTTKRPPQRKEKVAASGKSRIKKWTITTAVFVALGGAGYYAYLSVLESTKTVITNAPGRQVPQNIPNSETMHFDQPYFGFDAPADWKFIKHDTAPYSLYSYRSTLKNADNRYFDIYVDALPTNMAVNKTVAVRGQGMNLSHGMVSENCTTFTTGDVRTPGGAQALSVVAKWDGVEFMCDKDSVTRNVVGTSSPGAINRVELTGTTTGKHALFFVYTDNNYSPEYTIFYRMLESFVVK